MGKIKKQCRRSGGVSLAGAKAVNNMPIPTTHSALNIFQIPEVQISLDRGITEQVYPKTSVNGPVLEFELSGERTSFIDMRNVHLQLALQVIKMTSGDSGSLTESPIKRSTGDKVVFVNNIMHSLFSNCEVSLNGVQVSTANNLYHHKAYIDTEMSHGTDSKATWLECQGFDYEETPDDPESIKGDQRVPREDGASVSLYGRFDIDLFNSEFYLLPGVNIRIKLVRAPKEFVLFTTEDDDTVYRVKIREAILYVHKVDVSETAFDSMENALGVKPGGYEYMETIPKTFIIQTGQNIFIREDVFNGAPIRRLVMAMNTNAAFTGTLDTNPFHYQRFGLRCVKLFREGSAVGCTPLKTDPDYTRAYYNTIKALGLEGGGHAISLKDYADHFILVFTLTADLQANDNVTRPELTGGRIRLELEFNEGIKQPIELILLGERKSAIYIDEARNVLKNTFFNNG